MARIRVAGHTLAELDELSDHAIALVDTALHTVATKVAASLSATITAAGVDDLQVMLSLWDDEVDSSLAPFIADTYESGALAVGFDAANGLTLPPGQGIPTVTSDHVTQHLAKAKNRLSGVGDDLWHRARTSLLEGHVNGESIDQLAARVQAAAGLTAGRARTIARTEIISASNAGSLAQVHLIARSTDQKEWLATHDGRTREDHRHANGQRVDVHQPFSVGGWALQYPGDPSGPAGETINCRCTLTYLLDETPSITCSCAGALTAAIEVKSESCICPMAPTSHGHGVAELPLLTDADKQAVYNSFKAQGSISPAYGGAKIYKHLQGMQSETLLDEFQILKVVDELYLKSGGKSSFAEKFDDWLTSAAGKKATKGLEKPVVSQVLKQADEAVKHAAPKIKVLSSNDIITRHDKALDIAFDESSSAFGHVIAESGANLRMVIGDGDLLRVERLINDQWKLVGVIEHSSDIDDFFPGTVWHTPKLAHEVPTPNVDVPPIDVPKPIIEKPPLPSEAAQAKDLTDISNVSPNVKEYWFVKFKSVKPVTPGWGGSAVYKTLQQAKEMVKNDPAFHGLNDAQLLKMLDEYAQSLGKAGEKTYFGEVNTWVSTPAGKKAVEKQLSGVKVTTPKLEPLKPSVPKPHAPTAAAEHSGDITHVSDGVKTDFFNNVKSQGIYLSSPPDKMYAAIQHIKDTYAQKYGQINDLQALRILDDVGAKKLGVEDKHLYEKKIVDWLKTPAGKKAALEANMSPVEKAAVAAKKLVAEQKKLAEQQKMLKEIEKHYKVDTSTIPTFDPTVSAGAFRDVSVDAAQAMQNAMAQEHSPWTPTQRAALKKYTGGSYSEMNNHLRRGTVASDATRLAVRNAQHGMRPSTRAVLVRRGTGFSNLGVQNAEQVQQLVGKTMQDKGFMSTSAGGHAAFGGKVLMEIECPTGTPMAFIKSISHYSNENEMLLAAGLKYRVMSVRHEGSKTVVRVRIVP